MQLVPSFWKFSYRFLILPALWGGFHVLGLFNHKVRRGLRGRKGLASRARAARLQLQDKPLILFHCASMGELEALHPLASKLAARRVALALIYFSPSAESAAKKADCFAYVDYSPTDTRRSVRRFLASLKPQALAITKHDVWPNLVWECRRAGIPVFLINASFPPNSRRFWPVVRSFQKAIISSTHMVLTVSREDAERARRLIGDSVPIHVAGDSRYDRMIERISRAASEISLPADAFVGRFVLVAGSTHAADEDILLPAIANIARRHPHFLCLLVPHEPVPSALERIQTSSERLNLRVHLLSQWKGEKLGQVLCVDRVGILATLYERGQLAYVGGGFDRGVHSVLEPMAHGLPVLAGPNIDVSHEARMAKLQNIVQVVTETTEVENWIDKFISDDSMRHRVGEEARVFVEERLGASAKIADFLQRELNLDDHR